MNSIKFIYILILLLTPSLVYSQIKIPALPELKFAKIVNKDKYLGDRWSFMETGSANKPVIVALHGAGGNSMDWRFQFDGLSKNFRVIAWNAPGYMLSDGFKTESPNCQDFAEALADFLDTLKLEKVYLVGNSFGSRVSQCFAMNYPNRVIKMALVGVSTGPNNMPEEIKNKIISQRLDQIKDGGYAFGNKRVGDLVGKNTPPELLKVIGDAMKATNPRAFLQVTTKFVTSNGYSPKEVGAKVNIPTLLIAGDEDKITPFEQNAKILNQELKNSTLVVLKGIGHLPHLESPKEVNKLVKKFFLK
jgi:pimeloyl-ACP methyl ester carboxylesterase